MTLSLTHYQRLKVAPDAPPEVIRAAYRVLAAKLHPDRNGGGAGGPGDAMHAQMVALNAAYEVLIDPAQRAAYDASLKTAQSRSAPAAAAEAESHDEDRGGPPTRVDMEWLTPSLVDEPRWWPPTPRMAAGGGAALLLMGVLLGAWVWQVKTQTQMDRALSDHYLALPASVEAVAAEPQRPAVATTERASVSSASTPVASSAPSEVAVGNTVASVDLGPIVAGRRQPTVEELSRMTDEQLLQVLPMLDRPPGASRSPAVIRAEAQHMLDGKPLSLRTDKHLVDPLAPEPGASVP